MESIEKGQAEALPGCMICGRRDNTLRYVTYPFVFSLVVMTFRRSLVGLWCGKHRLQRQLFASLITSIFGWLGIPYGFVFTPLALFQLAKGGLQNKQLNAQLLAGLGTEKHQQGDYRGALHCYAESLRFQDNPEIQARLSRLSSMQAGTMPTSSGVLGFLSFFVAPVVVFLIGLVVGLFDTGIAWVVSRLLSGSENIFAVIISWIPLVMMIVVSLIISVNFLGWILKTTQCTQNALATCLSFLVSLSLINGVATGQTTGKLITYMRYGLEFTSLQDALLTIGAVLTHGGFYQLAYALTSGETWGVILSVLLLLSAVFSLVVTLSSAMDETGTQNRLARSQAEAVIGASSRTPLFAWGGILTVLSMASLLYFLIFSQKSTVDALTAFDHLGNSYRAVEQGNYPIALQELDEAIQLRPGMVDAYVQLGWVRYQRGEFDLALTAFQEAARLDRDSADAHAGLGWALYQMGENGKSIDEFKLAIQINPGNLDAYLGLGWAYLYEDIENSILNFNSAVNIDPDSSDAHVGLGMAWYLSNDLNKAQDMLQKAINLDPQSSWGHTMLGYVLTDKGDEQLAIQSFTTAIGINPEGFDAHFGLGRAYLLSYQIDRAIQSLQKAIQISPNSAIAYNNLGFAYIIKTDFEAALANFATAAQVDPTSGASHAYSAMVYYQMDQPESMEAELQLAADAAANDGDANYAIGFALSEMNRFGEAEAYLLKAVESVSGVARADLYVDLGYAYMMQNKFDQATQAIDLAMEINPESSDASVARASVWISQEQLDRAAEELQRALELEQDNAYAHAVLSFVYFQSGLIELTIQEAETAVGYDAYNSKAYTQLAFAYFAQGKFEQALDTAQKAARLNPTNDVAHYILGRCLMEKGQKSEAILEFEKFLRYFWDRAYVRDYKGLAEGYLKQLKSEP